MTTAFLSLDVQIGILNFVPTAGSVFPHAAAAIAIARSTGHKIIHVGLGFEPGYPEISPKNARFSAIKERGLFVKGSESAQVHPSIYREGDLVVHKHRVGAFSGNALQMILTAHDIDRLVLFGVATSGIVLSTVRAAFDLDYQCIVVADACFDRDAEVHRVLTEKVFPGPASVVTVDTLAAALNGV